MCRDNGCRQPPASTHTGVGGQKCSPSPRVFWAYVLSGVIEDYRIMSWAFSTAIHLSSPLSSETEMVGNRFSQRLSWAIRQYCLRKLLGLRKSGMGRCLRPSAVPSPNSHFLLNVFRRPGGCSPALEHQPTVGIKPSSHHDARIDVETVEVERCI